MKKWKPFSLFLDNKNLILPMKSEIATHNIILQTKEYHKHGHKVTVERIQIEKIILRL